MDYANRGEEFEALFNTLDDELRRRVTALGDQRDGRLSFAESVSALQKHDPGIRTFSVDLLEYSDLRNAIVHSRGRDGLRVIAEPVPEALTHFTSIVLALTKPKLALSFSNGAPRHFAPSEPLANALEHMREHEFSQIVVKSGDDPLQMLTSNGITNWLVDRVDEGVVSLKDDVQIVQALRFEPQQGFRLIDRNATEFDVRELFQSFPPGGSNRLQAVIVTEHGKPAEKALGIITPWDLFGGVTTA